MKSKPKQFKPVKGYLVLIPSWKGRAKYYSGAGFGHRARIFPTRTIAKDANYGTDDPIIPVLISPLPTPRKASKPTSKKKR